WALTLRTSGGANNKDLAARNTTDAAVVSPMETQIFLAVFSLEALTGYSLKSNGSCVLVSFKF
ncbi:hypothetical protein QTO17_02850, partial [Vibrio owensii]